MATEIGQALREARMRQQIDMRAVEGATKIRAKYLRALENEEWEILPGPAYVRSFLRTYANFLSLDGDVLVDEYRRRYEEPEPQPYALAEPALREPRRGGVRPPRSLSVPDLSGGAVAVIAAVIIIGFLLVLGLTAGSKDNGTGEVAKRAAAQHHKVAAKPKPQPQPQQVSVRISPKQDVWVCLIDDSRTARVNGVVLTPGDDQGPFKSKRFDVTFGNGFVGMQVNGKDVGIPDSSSPLGYEVTPEKVRPLDPTARPTCT
jgi:cytoskeleton protein RodZ